MHDCDTGTWLGFDLVGEVKIGQILLDLVESGQ